MPGLTSLERNAHIHLLRRVMRTLVSSEGVVEAAFGGETAPRLFVRNVPEGDLGYLGTLLFRHHSTQVTMEVVGSSTGQEEHTLDICIMAKRGR
jgi:hypothetical protein